MDDTPAVARIRAAAGSVDWYRPCRPLEVFVEPEGPDDGQVRKAPLVAAPPAQQRASLTWPWGLVAIGVMALAWVGIYLLWNGIVFVFNW